MTQVFNVHDFGARGDGITDDTKAIQSALDAAETGGGTVYMPAGEYRVKGDGDAGHGALLIRDNVTLTGDGMGMTVVKVVDGYSDKLTGIIRTPSGQVNHDVTIRDLSIDGNRAKTSNEIDGFFAGVKPDDPRADTNITVERVEIRDCSRYGFDPHERINNLNISDGISHDNGYDGVAYDMIIGGTLKNMVTYDNDRHGINVVTSSRDVLLENNVSYDNGRNGFVTQRGSDHLTWTGDVTIKGGAAYENGENGVAIRISDHVTVTEVNASSNGMAGVLVEGTIRN